MEGKWPVDATESSHCSSIRCRLLNVTMFFALGLRVSGRGKRSRWSPSPGRARRTGRTRGSAASGSRPSQGSGAMTRIDWLVLAGFTIRAFVARLHVVLESRTSATSMRSTTRSGIEYLKGCASTRLGVSVRVDPSAADQAAHRALDLDVRRPRARRHRLRLAVPQRRRRRADGPLLYVFAKRLIGSTLFAAIAAGHADLRRLPLRAVAHRDARDLGRVLLADLALRVLPRVDGERRCACGSKVPARIRLARSSSRSLVGTVRCRVGFEPARQYRPGTRAGTTFQKARVVGVPLRRARLLSGRALDRPPFRRTTRATSLVRRGLARSCMRAGRTHASFASTAAARGERRLAASSTLTYKRDGTLRVCRRPAGDATFTPDGPC